MEEDSPLVWMEETCLVPVDAVEAEGKGKDYDENGSEGNDQPSCLEGQLMQSVG